MHEAGPGVQAGLIPAESPGGPFTDSAVRASLYATADRLARRSGALRAARIAGRPAEQVIADLAANRVTPGGAVADVGCGRGATTARLAKRLAPRVLLAVDLSPALLAVARTRLRHHPVRSVCADFHRLPLPDGGLDLVVAAFCLYHSPRPADVIAELARCLAPHGTAVLVTKSADSYRELDELVAASLDTHATSRPSLYATAHSGNLAALAGGALDVIEVIHERHRFRFTDLGHTAAYLSTSPKYALPTPLRGQPEALAAAMRAGLPEGPVTATSTVTYLVARRPDAGGRR